MALTIIQFALLATFITVFQIGRGSSLHIVAVPEPFNEKIHEQVNITCISDGSSSEIKTVQTLWLEKNDKTIAVIGQDGIVMGHGSKTNMQANGNLDVDVGFLNVIIQNPGLSDIGTYTCRMYYQGPNSQLREEGSSTNVTMDNEDLLQITTYLIEKVANLEKTVQDQEQILKREREVNTKQDNVLNERVLPTMERLQSVEAKHSRMIEDIVGRDSFTSAFSVYDPKSSVSNGVNLVFTKSRVNVGNHYNMATGVFTAPRKGLYVFHLNMFAQKNDALDIHFRVNNIDTAAVYAMDTSYIHQSSISIILPLVTGDKVFPYVVNGGNLPWTSYLSFDGYMLKLL